MSQQQDAASNKGISEIEKREAQLNVSFSPSAPINDSALFAGRKDQRREIVGAVMQKGQHVLLFGERGVGKTSLANTLHGFLKGGKNILAVRSTCTGSDDYSTVWRNVFSEIWIKDEQPLIGFTPAAMASATPLSESAPEFIRPNDVRRLLTQVGQHAGIFIVIIDEFDRIPKGNSALFADTVKMLSDHAVPVTLILVGVADSVEDLLREHASVERALVQVLMPRMSDEELREIIIQGLGRAKMTAEPTALDQIVKLSQGLPHYTHLLGLYSGLHANERGRIEVVQEDVGAAIAKALEKAQESIKTAHYKATVSPRKDSLFIQVLLAAALAKTDERGFFVAAEVRDPMSRIMGSRYDIPAFSQHLNTFCEKERGPVFEKRGTTRKFRFRFVNPLLQPFIIMHGLSKGLIVPGDVR